MITDYQDYENRLWTINNTSHTSIATLLPVPPKEELISIDLNTRKINIPKSFVIVSQDHAAETLFFTFDRYFDGMDLANTCCIVQFQNAKGEEYYYTVPYFDIKTDSVNQKIIMPWVIQNAATKYAGTVKFAIKFFMLDAASTSQKATLLYELNTLPAEAIVEQGQNWDLDDISQDSLVFDKEFIQGIHDYITAKNNGDIVLKWIDNF